MAAPEDAIGFKNLMSQSLIRFLEDNPDQSKKSVAIELGASQADLSHWLSPRTTFTLPGHLVPKFCRIVGDNALIWHLHERYEEGA